MYIHAEFPEGIESIELYEMVKCYKLNVLDLKDKIYLYGEIRNRWLPAVLEICSKFSYKEIAIKNPAG